MEGMNGQFSDDRAVKITGDDSDASVKIAALEQENLQLVHEKDAIQKKIVELKKSIEEAVIEKEKLLKELEESKAEIKTLGYVAERAAGLEGEVSRLQHDLISTTSELGDVNGELNEVRSALDGFRKRDGDKQKEFEAVVDERNMLLGKLMKLEAKEEEYLSEMNEKERDIGDLRAKVEELMVVAGKSGDDKKGVDNLRRELEVKVGELEKKLKEKEMEITGFIVERETTVVEGKAGGLMTGEINLGWQVIAGSALGFGLVGLVIYLRAKRT